MGYVFRDLPWKNLDFFTPESADAALLDLFCTKFPAVAASHTIRDRLKQERFYRVKPTWLRWVDNRRGFGWKYEMKIEQVPAEA